MVESRDIPPPKQEQPNNPLHGMTLAAILEQLLADHGWEDLGRKIDIRCFTSDPSIKSSLKFLRKTDWARGKVEALYLSDRRREQKRKKRNLQRKAMRQHRAAQEQGCQEPIISEE